MDKLDRAIYDTVHGYPGGVQAVANRTGENAGTLFNRVDPAQERHHPTVRGLLSWMLTADDYQALFALASACHFGCYHLGDFSDCSDMELLDLVLNLSDRRGRLDQIIKEAFADNVLTAKEFQRIDKAMDNAIRANLELKTRLKALVQEG